MAKRVKKVKGNIPFTRLGLTHPHHQVKNTRYFHKTRYSELPLSVLSASVSIYLGESLTYLVLDFLNQYTMCSLCIVSQT